MTTILAANDIVSPFAEVAFSLLALGYSVLPLLPANCELAKGPLPPDREPAYGKAPADYTFGRWRLRTHWNDYRVRLPSEYEVQHWASYPGANIGVVLGTLGQIIALDFDYDVDGLHAQLMDMLPESPCRKIGQKGFTAFYRYNGEKSESWSRLSGDDRRAVLEVLSDGRQTVIPPSIHPVTLEPYYWEGQPLHETAIDDLPFLPSGFVDRARTLIKNEAMAFPNQQPRRERIDIKEWLEGRFAFKDATPEKTLEALRYIHPDDTHQLWVEMGMAIKAQFGDDGFHIWDAWSSMGAKYNDPHNAGRMRTAWKSFKGSAKTIASLFFEAQRRGFINVGEIEGLEYPANLVIHAGGNLNAIANTPAINKEVPPPAVVATIEPDNDDGTSTWVMDAPGLVGDVARWILATSRYPEPELALAASIAFVGGIKAHKVALTNGLRSNVYTLGVAGSGQGKNHAREAIKVLLESAGGDELIGGNPASAAGLFRTLADGNGRRLLLMDEFGKILKTFTGKGAGSHLAMIPTLMMELFSSAAIKYTGTEYSNYDGKRKRQDIDQPCLCIYGTSTPDNFYQALTSGDAIDGFLSRWLIWHAGKPQLYPQKNRLDLKNTPQKISDDIRELVQQKTNAYASGNIDAFVNIKPIVLSFSSVAEKTISKFEIDMRKKMIKSSEKNNGFDAIYARVAEHAFKMALIASPANDALIGQDVVAWACDVALARGEYMCGAITSHVADTDAENEFKRVLRLIRAAGDGGISHTKLLIKTRFLRGRMRRNEIIEELVDTNQVVAEKISDGERGRPKVVYTAVKE